MEQTLIPDTHAFVKEMTAAGMPQPVAEAFVSNYTKHLLANHATKQDIQESNQATTAAIETLRKETQITIAQLETKLIRWVVGVGVGLGLTLSSIIVGTVFAAYQMLAP